MKATIRITDGTEVRHVTPAIANDKAIMKRFGFWKDEVPTTSAKTDQIAIKVADAEVDMLAQKEQPIDMTKNQIMDALKSAGVKFNPLDKKEVLQELLSNTK